MKISKSLAMLGGSFAVYVAVACSSAAFNDRDPKIDGVRVVDAIADLGVDTGAIVDAVRDALNEGGPADAKADPSPTSGTRLRARYNVEKSVDGAVRKTFASWYDSTRKEACNIAGPMVDGTRRCLPSNPLGSLTIVGGYVDASCTKALAIVPLTGCPLTTKYVWTSTTGSGCSSTSTTRIHSIGGETTPPTTWYQLSTTGACTAATTAWPYVASAYKTFTTTELAPSEFAEVTITEETE